MPKPQSIIFDKHMFTKAQAIYWLTKNNYKHHKIDITNNFYRFRQRPPVTGNYYSKYITPGILFIFEQ